MSGSLTAWFPDRLTTQAGVSGVASSNAITASTPILLPWTTDTQWDHCVTHCASNLVFYRDTYKDSVKSRGRAASLYVSKDSGARVEAEPVSHQLRTKNTSVSLSCDLL